MPPEKLEADCASRRVPPKSREAASFQELKTIRHGVFQTPGYKGASAYYRDRLNFRLSDWQKNSGIFARADGANDHHNVYFLNARLGLVGEDDKLRFDHVNYGVEDLDEIMVGKQPGAAPPGEQQDESVLRPGLLALIGVLGAVTGFTFLVVPVNLGYLLNDLGVSSATSIGTAYGLNSVGVIAGTLVFGWVLARRFGVGLQLGLSTAIAAAGFLLMQTASTYGAMTVAGVVNGFGCGILLPTMVTWTMRSVPAAKRGLGNGAFQSALYLGMSTSPLLVVGLQSQLGGRPAAMAAIGSAVAVLAGLAVACAAIGTLKGARR